MSMENLESRIAKIEERNRRVEADKKWETSLISRTIIAIGTYVFASMFLFSINASNPLVSALVPTTGYLISTLSLPFFKKIWLKQK